MRLRRLSFLLVRLVLHTTGSFRIAPTRSATCGDRPHETLDATEMPGERLHDDRVVISWAKRRGGLVKKHCRRAGIETYRLNQAHGIFLADLCFFIGRACVGPLPPNASC